jgi:hypothetical protein
MVALQIRDVSEDMRAALVARACGQSPQAYLLELVESQDQRLRNVALDSFAGRSDGSRSLPGETSAEWEKQRGVRDSSGTVA